MGNFHSTKESTPRKAFQAFCSSQGSVCHKGWVMGGRGSAVTYLCGEIFNHLRLIRQSLLLQGKRTMSWGLWGQ